MTTRTRRGRPPHDDVLTPAEWRTVHAVQHGMTNRNIAERWGISLDAVKYHVANVIGKLGVSNRASLRQWFRAPKARGVEFTSAPHMVHRHADGTEEWMAFFKDPEGRPLAIMSQAMT